LLRQCNAKCGFCFSVFNDIEQTMLTKEEHLLILGKIADAGYKKIKITFVGGEPLLCPWIDDLIDAAKGHGMTTMLVTNGFLLREYIQKNEITALDWIALSIDSLVADTNKLIGRYQKDAYWGESEYFSLVDLIREHNKRFKINTVINRFNLMEDFSKFITLAKPERWKMLQVLPIVNQNDFSVNKFLISDEEFLSFIRRHSHLSEITNVFQETNLDMIDSYIMISPDGRLFQNSTGSYTYSNNSLLDTDFNTVLQEINFDQNKYKKRGAIYQW
jgi:radical S-adenosyl methionine domain-containing protein 2